MCSCGDEWWLVVGGAVGGGGGDGYDVTNLVFGGNSAENGGLSRQSSFDLRTRISSEFFLGFNRPCFEKFDSGKKGVIFHSSEIK